jgi:hypothetical protein
MPKTDERDPMTRVHISHPDVENTGVSTLKALQNVWEPRGWSEVSEEESNPVLGAVAPADVETQEVAEQGQRPAASKAKSADKS